MEKDYAAADRQAFIASVPAQQVTHPSRAFTVGIARQRHGKKFAADPGGAWIPNQIPFLTRWQAQQRSS